jgi:mannose-6-phosphate isomerase
MSTADRRPATDLYPLLFQPRFKERVWGGRTLQSLYGKALPPDLPIGESWEVSDRDSDESVVSNGPLAGLDLRQLMERYSEQLLGRAHPAAGGRFPILCKILDARETLSVQVHPSDRGGALLGEPKTEMWYIAAADPGAVLYVGLRRGVTREEFERRVTDGTVAECLHRIPVSAGDSMFLPSGRVHAIGGGLVIFEIQQNSDTTFRVFDWNRMGLDGRPRPLQVTESLASIDFTDFEPALAGRQTSRTGRFVTRRLVADRHFTVDVLHADGNDTLALSSRPRIVAVVDGRISIAAAGHSTPLAAGQFCLVPAVLSAAALAAEANAAFLLVEIG